MCKCVNIISLKQLRIVFFFWHFYSISITSALFFFGLALSSFFVILLLLKNRAVIMQLIKEIWHDLKRKKNYYFCILRYTTNVHLMDFRYTSRSTLILSHSHMCVLNILFFNPHLFARRKK